MAETTGEIILFTDDDVRPPPDWIARMCAPLARRKSDAVCGGVRIAPALLRPWMTTTHRAWLASPEWINQKDPKNLVGANMGFDRDVLRRVPKFDTELGAGALGSCEETLFSLQLIHAGCKIFNNLDVCLEHHFQLSRLKREAWLDAAKKMGASQAYIGHHWEHWPCRFGKLRLYLATRKLAAWRTANAAEVGEEGCREQELNLILRCSLIRQHLLERGRPRNYERHGLVKFGVQATATMNLPPISRNTV